ncbi:MAG TPA: MBOAT family O-acyltransferase [Blastocatellia bacterium]|nr:MBOAT family O-acyltransferase [Blastocatellia bacterium]
MLFTDSNYYAFLMVLFFAYWVVASRPGPRVGLLAVASGFFYWRVAGNSLALLVGISVIDFATTRLMADSKSENRRRLLLSVSLFASLGALCYFKYAGFILDSVARALTAAGMPAPDARFDILAPIGISFFIFQSVAFVLDVYRRDARPAQSYLDHFAFVSFFPTIIAGPILRARNLIPHLREPVGLTSEMGGQAIFLIACGLIKKIAIADYLSANLVERVFDFPERFSSLEVLAAVYGYAVQIYSDFSGYSDIAAGSALLLGFSLPLNFNAPYRARDLPDFWRRWHISLSSWLRDYVFFTAAGRRVRDGGALRAALLITMLVGGLWHGAAWTFAFWGLMHGAGLVFVRALPLVRRRMPRPWRESRLPRALSCLFTFHFVCFSWIFFRAESLDRALSVLNQLAALTFGAANLAMPVALLIPLCLSAHWVPEAAWSRASRAFCCLPAFAQACALLLLATGLYFVAGSDVAPFIYSRF